MEVLINNLKAWLLSMPTNFLILLIICVLFMIFGDYKFKDCIKLIIGYLILCFLLGLIGLTMPSFIDIFWWLKGLIESVAQ